MEDRGSIPCRGRDLFSLRQCFRTGSGAHPVSYPTGTMALSSGVKLPGREANHSPPPSAKVKNAWSYICAPPYVFMVWCIIKHRDNFTFTCIIIVILNGFLLCLTYSRTKLKPFCLPQYTYMRNKLYCFVSQFKHLYKGKHNTNKNSINAFMFSLH
jgi:hypothetical protein